MTTDAIRLGRPRTCEQDGCHRLAAVLVEWTSHHRFSSGWSHRCTVHRAELVERLSKGDADHVHVTPLRGTDRC